MSVLKADAVDLDINTREFILSALKDANYRLDGRTTQETRPLRVTYARSEGQASAEIQLGKTRVLTVVTCEVVPPYPDRPTEGFLNLNVEISPMAATGVDNSRSSPAIVEVDRIIERGLRESHALDTEALCIVAGAKAWSIRCDIHVLDHGGNVIDAAALATVAALRHFRLPEVTVTEASAVVVHHSFEKEPAPLPLHHVPIAVSFALFHEGTVAAIDPTEREEAVMGGRITYVLNVHKELCALQKIGGLPLTPENIMLWVQLASGKVAEWHEFLEGSLAEADKRAREERLRSIRGTAAPPAAPASATAPVLEELARGAEEIKHLDFAELHVPIRLREEAEGSKPSAEEEQERLQLLQKAAEDAQKFRAEAEQAAKAKAQVEKTKGNGAGLKVGAKRPAPTQQAAAESQPSQRGGGDSMEAGSDGGAGDEDDSEEEETAVVVSEFAAAGGTGGRGRLTKSPVPQQRAARTKRDVGRKLEEEEAEDDDDGAPTDLREIVRKPKKAKATRGRKPAGGGAKGKK